MCAPARTAVAALALVVLASRLPPAGSQEGNGVGVAATIAGSVAASEADDEVLPLSMQSRFRNWRLKRPPKFMQDLPTWEEQLREQHPLDSAELRGPFVYSREEETALRGNLRLSTSEWNPHRGGIGGRPRPRYCVLDAEWRERTYPDKDFSPQGFRRTLQNSLGHGRLHKFLVNDRFQEPRGHDVLTGHPLSMDLYSSRSCPVLRPYSEADWSCVMLPEGGQKNGLLKMDMPFKDVRTIRLSSSTLLDTAEPEQIPGFDVYFMLHGPSFAYCHEGTCDCDRVFEEHGGHFPRVCDMRSLLKSLEPYQEEFARQRITVSFSLYDMPWLVATNNSDTPEHGIHYLSGELPAQMVQSNWFRRIFVEGKRDRIPGIDTQPKTFSSAYLEGREEILAKAMQSADLESKRGILAAWGQRHSVTAHSNESVALSKFIEGHPWVDHRLIPPDHYWLELAKYRFLVAPRGNGIQAPKFAEALAVMTIPITLRYACFEDLQMYGFPLVLVDKWEDITPKALAYWWDVLSPRLEEARWLITHFGVNSLLYGNCD